MYWLTGRTDWGQSGKYTLCRDKVMENCGWRCVQILSCHSCVMSLHTVSCHSSSQTVMSLLGHVTPNCVMSLLWHVTPNCVMSLLWCVTPNCAMSLVSCHSKLCHVTLVVCHSKLCHVTCVMSLQTVSCHCNNLLRKQSSQGVCLKAWRLGNGPFALPPTPSLESYQWFRNGFTSG